jgi:hypothetical protein
LGHCHCKYSLYLHLFRGFEWRDSIFAMESFMQDFSLALHDFVSVRRSMQELTTSGVEDVRVSLTSVLRHKFHSVFWNLLLSFSELKIIRL